MNRGKEPKAENERFMEDPAASSAGGDYVPDTVAAQLIGSTAATLRRWRHEGRHLRYYKVGSSVRYSTIDLRQFLQSRLVEASKGKTQDLRENQTKSGEETEPSK